MGSNSQWYVEGQTAKHEGKSIAECPYKVGTFGYSEWVKGYKS